MKLNKYVQRWYENHLNALEISDKESKQLFKLERKLHQIALDQCNGTSKLDEMEEDKIISDSLDKVAKIAPKLVSCGLFFNGDARGYAIKVKTPISGMYTGWGGYGIVAPDFREIK